jgi:hypothetical protein
MHIVVSFEERGRPDGPRVSERFEAMEGPHREVV